MSARIVLHEVGPRDGLQVEKTVVPTETKLRWIGALCEAGLDVVQVDQSTGLRVTTTFCASSNVAAFRAWTRSCCPGSAATGWRRSGCPAA